MSHWTDHHIKENDAGTFDAFDEAGILHSTHATREEARDALVIYDAIELKVINQLPDAEDLIQEALHGAGPGEKALAEVAAQHIRRLGKQLTYKEDLCTRQRHLEAKLQGEINDLEAEAITLRNLHIPEYAELAYRDERIAELEAALERLSGAAFEVCNDWISTHGSGSRLVFDGMLESTGDRTEEGEPIDWLAQAAFDSTAMLREATHDPS